MPTTVTWLWFGNQPQLNSTASTPATQAEANSLVGYSAVGPNQIQPVEVTGVTRTVWIDRQNVEAFATTYNAHSASPMTYSSPSTETTVTSEMTGFFSVVYEITFPGGGSRQETGVAIQMANGDIFFRPSIDTVDAWDDIEVLHGVSIVSATPLNANTYAATVSFNPSIYDLPITCFTAGTLILTAQGERKVEELAEGDLIWTRDHGFQPLRWRGARRVERAELAQRPSLLPIRISAGALGLNQPATDLVVSPQHRVLVRSNIAQRMFGARELLVAAKQMVGLPGIAIDHEVDGVTYVHLMFDRHEVLMSNGAETESLYPGPQALAGLGAAVANEIYALFPELRDTPDAFSAARPFATGKRARQMANRHLANAQPLAS